MSDDENNEDVEDVEDEEEDVDDQPEEEEEEDDDNAFLDDDSAWLDEEDLKPKPQKYVFEMDMKKSQHLSFYGPKSDRTLRHTREKNLVNEHDFVTGSGSKEATQRLVRDLNSFLKSETKKFGVSAEPQGDNLYLWTVKFFGFESDTDLGKDLAKYKQQRGVDHVELQMIFPAEYPFKPPFIFVKRPRFQFHTGHVTIGGSVCMELLTASGWTPTNDIESILVQIRSEMLVGGARLDFANSSDYTEQEAKAAFVSARCI